MAPGKGLSAIDYRWFRARWGAGEYAARQVDRSASEPKAIVTPHNMRLEHFALCLLLETRDGGPMARTKISSIDLAWIFLERLRSLDDCARATTIAIVPSKGGWRAVTNKMPSQRPLCARRIDQIQNQLRKVYVLAKD
jgi:hypothetical protein